MFCFALGPRPARSGLTPDSALKVHSRQAWGLYGVPEIEPRSKACKADALPTVLTLQPLESFYLHILSYGFYYYPIWG